MKLSLINGLPFVSASLTYGSQSITLTHVLVDTGSGGTVFAADRLIDIGVVPEPNDALRRIAGVGGAEFVFQKTLEQLAVGRLTISDFCIEVGALDYGFDINGILGIDFLVAVGAIVNLRDMIIDAA